jgi:membrane protein implicated in regulation of membrane protease activity
MLVAFAACFIAGLLLSVFVMMHGVERGRVPSARPPHEETGAHDPRTEPRPFANRQGAAAFVTLFGAAGYLTVRAGFGLAVSVGLAALAGVAGFVLSGLLLKAWALPSARREVVDDRYLLQGHPGVVTRAIPAEGTGEIAYEADGRRWTVAARGWDGAPIEAGAEVAIERVEGGVAYVEQWAQVEARL